MKLEKPILFHSLEELYEAVIYSVIERTHIALYESKEYSLPTLFWNDTDIRLDHIGDSEKLLNQNDEYLSILRKSVDWKDVKDKYKPKEWYELSINKGKVVWVKDDETCDWDLDVFEHYEESLEFPFICISNEWKYAKPVLPTDLINEL